MASCVTTLSNGAVEKAIVEVNPQEFESSAAVDLRGCIAPGEKIDAIAAETIAAAGAGIPSTIRIMKFFANLSQIPFYEQNQEENIERFSEILRDLLFEGEELSVRDFIAIFSSLANSPFLGCIACLQLLVDKLEYTFPEIHSSLFTQYFIPRTSIPNLRAVQAMIERKCASLEEETQIPVIAISIDDLAAFLNTDYAHPSGRFVLIVLDSSHDSHHYFPVMVEETPDEKRILLSDSVIPKERHRLTQIARVATATGDRPVRLFAYEYSRQTDWHTCPYFAMRDAFVFCRSPGFFENLMKDPRNQKRGIVPGTEVSYHKVHVLPGKMMTLTQYFAKTPFHTQESLLALCPELERAAPIGRRAVGRPLSVLEKMHRFSSSEQMNYYSYVKRTKYLSLLIVNWLEIMQKKTESSLVVSGS